MSTPETSTIPWATLAVLLQREIPALASIPVAQLVLILPLLYHGGELLLDALKKSNEHMKEMGWHLGFYPPNDPNGKPTMLDRDGNPLTGVFA